MSRLLFQVLHECPDTQARAGVMHTLHGEVRTPLFMPVGTQATVKTQTVDILQSVGSRILLANTYHLLLRPGAEVFRKFGGIHRFMNWDGPVLTDSGGFQIFSLPHSRKMNEEGASFQSYVDGTTHLLSPEASIQMQRAIGSDIMMVLDQCIPSTSSHAEAKAAMELTHRWAVRSLNAREDSPQSMFGIVQGACFHDLRKQSADFLTQLPFDGFAIGGLAVGEGRELRDEFTEATAKLLPRNLPRYLMGVGTPIDILEAVHRGVDMFDCILPTQLSQRGVAFTSHGKLQLRRTVYRLSEEPVDADCTCDLCKHYSRAYIHHLTKADEPLGWQLLSTHNLVFYHRMMREIREALAEGRFLEYYRSKKPILLASDESNPVTPPKKSRTAPAVRKLKLGDYEVHTSVHGFSSIKQISSGEIMHSVSDPVEEARLLYVDQPGLEARLLEQEKSNEFVIWDVGLGAATNAMAAIQCFEKLWQTHSAHPESLRPLRIVSFEKDLDPIRLAIRNAAKFPHLRHPAPTRFLENTHWKHASDRLVWELKTGDFLDHFEHAPAPDLIWYDPFSYKTDSELWRPEVFERIFQHCSPKSSELYTYSASTGVRVALLSAGFHVGRGVGTGPKTETTFAVREPQHPHRYRLLDSAWLKQWDRSTAKFPPHLPTADHALFERRIREHGQFNPQPASSPQA